jgi:cell wall-associated NlpC family hydrolase
MNHRLASVAVPVVVAFLLIFGIALIAGASGALTPPSAQASGLCAAPPVEAGTSIAGQSLGTAQVANARVIYDVAVSMGLPSQAAIIAIATAMQESRLQNLPYGTSDSLGLFQQRPSQGWGTPAQIMQPAYAARAFYNALVQVPGWQSLPLTVAAQDVQHSAYPGAYAQWQGLATDLVASFGGSAQSCLASNNLGVPASGTTHVPAGFMIPADVPAQVRVAILFTLAQLGRPYIWGGTGPAGFDCSGLVMMAYRAAGVDLPRTTFQQVLAGTPVNSLDEIQPGDLLFTPGSDGTAASPGHVGMYIGFGLVVQAPETGEPVMLTPIAPYWQDNTVVIRRVVG